MRLGKEGGQTPCLDSYIIDSSGLDHLTYQHLSLSTENNCSLTWTSSSRIIPAPRMSLDAEQRRILVHELWMLATRVPRGCRSRPIAAASRDAEHAVKYDSRFSLFATSPCPVTSGQTRPSSRKGTPSAVFGTECLAISAHLHSAVAERRAAHHQRQQRQKSTV